MQHRGAFYFLLNLSSLDVKILPMKRKRGFTLIELVIVTSLLGILAWISVLDIGSYQAQHFRAALERIAADLRYVKNLALTTSKWHGVIFDVGSNTYTLYETDGVTDTPLTNLVYPDQDYSVNLTDDYHGVALSALINLGGTKVEFSPYGVPFTDKNGSALSATGMVVVAGHPSAGGCTCGDVSYINVNIAPQTGRIYIQ
jgi:prepilin-type N-terminal cleavage/methylation domain-containing protein